MGNSINSRNSCRVYFPLLHAQAKIALESRLVCCRHSFMKLVERYMRRMIAPSASKTSLMMDVDQVSLVIKTITIMCYAACTRSLQSRSWHATQGTITNCSSYNYIWTACSFYKQVYTAIILLQMLSSISTTLVMKTVIQEVGSMFLLLKIPRKLCLCSLYIMHAYISITEGFSLKKVLGMTTKSYASRCLKTY